MQEEKKDLQVLVTASDRLKKTNFNGFDLQKDPKILKTKKVRQNKMHLKFPLYTDEQIGFTDLKNRGNNLVNSVSEIMFLTFLIERRWRLRDRQRNSSQN